jgi:GMP synthase (glutamine-hydrolysing)
MTDKTALAIRHVHFEDLGTFAAVLSAAGYRLQYLDVGVDDLEALVPTGPDLLIVLGGPVGVYDNAAYPVLDSEMAVLKTRLAANRPTFGICLGAQMMAAALGARVSSSGIKEIGFSPLTLTAAGRQGPMQFLDGVAVLHWHGDMFDVPPGGALLAETPICPHQAFSYGPNLMGVQFHPEAMVRSGFERWLIGHTAELAGAGVDPRALRRDAERFGEALSDAGRKMFAAWLSGLESR